MKGKGEKKEPWLLIKEKDEFVRPAAEYSVIDEMPDSVAGLGAKKTAAKKTVKPAGKSSSTTVKSAPAPKAASKTAVAKKNSGMPTGAVKAALPETLSPQLATLVDGPPNDGADWLYEIKFDGYRIVARIDGRKVQLITRNGNDWTHKLPALAKALAGMKLPSGWLDGEIVVIDKKGLPDFQALQNAFDTAKTQEIVYYVFDLPFCNGYDLRGVPLFERRALLQTILAKAPSELVRYSDTFEATAIDVIASACRLGLEGVIGKRKESTYASRRSTSWIKLKCTQRQEFVIGGYTDPQGTRKGLGSLLLGVHDGKGKLVYAGNVGTGFDDRTLQDLKKKLAALASDRNPFSASTGIDRKAHWVKPTLLAEISFASWTTSGRIRHSVFHGLRIDKKAKAIVHEKPVSARSVSRSSASRSMSSKAADSTTALPGTLPKNMKVSHPERVIDPSTGTTKIDVIRFYALVAPLIMPHLKGRPVSLVRAPDGIGGELFFQKHMDDPLEGLILLDPALDPGHAPLMEIAKPLGLLAAAQMNVLEFHTWNGVKSAIDKPDRMTFDLDPGEGVEWPIMQESTLLMRSFLDQLGLKSFVKTSGGKGLHVVVPLKRRYDWDTIKDFSKAIVEHMANTLPMRFVAKSGPKNRVGKIFIDYLRNGFGATTVAAWSVRSRPGLGVSVPISWDEVDKLHSSAQWTIANIHTRLDKGNAPWDDYDKSAQNVTAAMKMLGFIPSAKK